MKKGPNECLNMFWFSTLVLSFQKIQSGFNFRFPMINAYPAIL